MGWAEYRTTSICTSQYELMGRIIRQISTDLQVIALGRAIFSVAIDITVLMYLQAGRQANTRIHSSNEINLDTYSDTADYRGRTEMQPIAFNMHFKYILDLKWEFLHSYFGV